MSNSTNKRGRQVINDYLRLHPELGIVVSDSELNDTVYRFA